jgi:fucose permease
MQRSTLLTLLAFLAFISLGLPDGLLGVAWPSIRAGFDLPLDALGLLVAVVTAGYLTSSFLSGALLRRFPLGTVLAGSAGAAAFALLGIALVPAWPLMLALGVVAGLAGGAVDAGLNAYGARYFSGRTLNWLHASWGLGTTIGPLIVTGVLDSGLVWRWAYAVAGTAQLALALTLFLERDRWHRLDPEAVPPPPSASTLSTLRRPVVWLGMLAFFVYTGVELAVAHWSFSLLTLGRGVGETAAGLYVTLYWGSLMAGRVLFGLVADRVPLVPTLRACIGAAVLGAALFWLEPTAALSLAGLMLIGFGLAPVFASLIRLTPERVGMGHADSAIGFQIAAAGLGGAVLTGLIGLLAGAFGLEVIGGAIFVAAVALLVLYEALVRTPSGAETVEAG